MHRRMRPTLVMGAAVLSVAAIGFLSSIPEASGFDAQERCILAGTWVGTQPDGANFMETFVPDVSGNVSQVHIRGRGANPLIELFPGARGSEAGTRGEAVRVSPDTWRYKLLSWSVFPNDDGGISEIAYFRVDEGITVLTDCDTQEAVNTISFFLPEQDADGDGIPDEGEVPFLQVPDLQLPPLKRLRA